MQKSTTTEFSVQIDRPRSYQSIPVDEAPETKTNNAPSSESLDQGRPKADVLYRLLNTSFVAGTSMMCAASFVGEEQNSSLAIGGTVATVSSAKCTVDLTQYAHEQAKYLNHLSKMINGLNSEIHFNKQKLSQDSTLPNGHQTNRSVSRALALNWNVLGFAGGALAGAAINSENFDYCKFGGLIAFFSANLITSIVYGCVIKKQKAQIDRLEKTLWDLSRELKELQRLVAAQEAKPENSMPLPTQTCVK